MKGALLAGLSGALFAVGLGVGGLSDPARVLGFLDFAGSWDPTLAFVMAGAVGGHTLLRRLILRRARPVAAPAFPVFERAAVDARLVAGAALFGVGWGLAGYCPGPALVSVSTGAGGVIAFVAAMALGMLLCERLRGYFAPRQRSGGAAAGA